MYNHKLTIRSIILFGAFSCLSLQTFSQTSYKAPVYDLIYETAAKNLPNSENNSSVKKLSFQSLSFKNEHDGFMVKYVSTPLNRGWTDFRLLKIENGNDLLEIYFHSENQTLMLKRYHYDIETNKSIDYVIYDRLFPEYHGVWSPVIKFYFGKNFIWIESLDTDFLDVNFNNAWHTPIFWGIDISSDRNMTAFLRKGKNANIHFFKPILTNPNNSKDISIYGFKTSDLIEHINKNFSSQHEAVKNTRNRENKMAVFKDNNELLLDQQVENEETLNEAITIYPNPTSHLVNVLFGKTNLDNTKFKFNLSDFSGRVILTDEIQVKPERHQIQIKLPNSLPKGVYFLNFTLGIEKGYKKLIIN